jgi:isocitrate dehydrogenase kinase/phosphatase
MKHHADLLDAGFWQKHKERILAGHVHDVVPTSATSASPAPAAARSAGEVAALRIAAAQPRSTRGATPGSWPASS